MSSLVPIEPSVMIYVIPKRFRPMKAISLTTLVNVKVSHIRPEYDNLKEWIAGKNNVYIGRKGIVFIEDENGNKQRYPKTDSIWANPFKVGDDRGDAITKYETYIRAKLTSGEISRDELEKLRGRTCGCWCLSSPATYEPDRTKYECHGQILQLLLHETEGKFKE